MKLIIASAVLLSLFATGECEFAWGGCPDIQTVSNFSLPDYLGTWYEIEKYPARFQKDLKCVRAVYTLADDGSVTVNNSGINEKTGDYQEAIGNAKPTDLENGKLGVKFSRWQPRGAYWVLATDYSSYSAVYSCTSLLLFRVEYLWVLSRQRQMEAEELRSLERRLIDLKLSTSDLTTTDQTGC